MAPLRVEDLAAALRDRFPHRTIGVHCTSLLAQSYVQAALYALAAITVLLAFHFRRLKLVLLSLVPVFLGSRVDRGHPGGD